MIKFLKGCKIKRVVCAAIVLTLFVTLFTPAVQVSAADTYPYNTLAKRTAVNKKIYDQAAKMNNMALKRYRDKSLTDMFETDEKGMTTTQQAVIKTKADEIIDKAAQEKGEALTDYEKLDAFHDWIIEHFYYYRNVNNLSSKCDNPYYLLTTEYNNGNGRIRSRCNGYSATFIAFARSQGFEACGVDGEYFPAARQKANNSLWAKKKTLNKGHTWSMARIDKDGNGTKEWIMVDCNADCWNRYTPSEGYVREGNFYDQSKYEAVRTAYFDVSAKRLAQSHCIISLRPGSKNVEYISNTAEKDKLKAFLNIKRNGKTNGKRINASYTTTNVKTWFAKNDVESKGDGYGKLYKLYWPADVGLYGKLDLSGFKSLQNFSVHNNKLTSLYLKNCPKLSTVSAYSNNLKTIDTRGSKNIKLLSVQGNPTTAVYYSFNTNKTATVKASTGGTVTVRYSKVSSSKHKHELAAYAKSGYKFVGWYSGNKLITKNKKTTKYLSKGFTYTAKFKKK